MIKIVIPAGAAKPAPPVGPALGSHGLNIMSFCKDFNAKTADITADVPIPVTITAFRDKSFEWEMKSPPVSYFIKKAAGIKEGSKTTGHEVKGDDIAQARVRDREGEARGSGVFVDEAGVDREQHNRVGEDDGRGGREVTSATASIAGLGGRARDP